MVFAAVIATKRRTGPSRAASFFGSQRYIQRSREVVMARSQKSKQLEFRLKTWGGRRKGAGRKRVAPRPRVPHATRPELHRSHPVLVTIRVVDGVPSLRQPAAWAAIVLLFRKARGRFGLHIVEFAILGNHIHLIVEVEDKDSLSRGMRGLNTRLAKRLNRVFQRRGKLIDGRYHSRLLTTPREVHNALRYVLFNAAKHRARAGKPTRAGIDPRSSAPRFQGWREHPRSGSSTKDFGTSSPRTWLLRIGWKRHGLLDAAPPS
jgi:putative transposase